MKLILFYSSLVICLLLVIFGFWYFERWLNYKFSYESMVEKQLQPIELRLESLENKIQLIENKKTNSQ